MNQSRQYCPIPTFHSIEYCVLWWRKVNYVNMEFDDPLMRTFQDYNAEMPALFILRLNAGQLRHY